MTAARFIPFVLPKSSRTLSSPMSCQGLRGEEIRPASRVFDQTISFQISPAKATESSPPVYGAQ